MTNQRRLLSHRRSLPLRANRNRQASTLVAARTTKASRAAQLQHRHSESAKEPPCKRHCTVKRNRHFSTPMWAPPLKEISSDEESDEEELDLQDMLMEYSRRRFVQFQDTPHIIEIPSHRCYPDKAQVWHPRSWLRQQIKRNRKEWAWEQGCVDRVVEEEHFVLDPATGQKVHPAHITK